MGNPELSKLSRLSQAVADGERVDWETQTRGVDADLARKLSNLRLVEAIVAASTSLSEEPASSSLEGARWGPLHILELIDEGGYGGVYRAHDPILVKDVALKLLKPVAGDAPETSRLSEARILARVRHPNVLTVHGAAVHEGRAGLWTELLEGRTLERCLAEQGPFNARETALIGADLCKALAAVHAAGLVHRDVKTANVMREQGGRIVLLDFSCGTPSSTSPVHSLVGTPFFMAPELFAGKDSGTAVDIYALGVLLYRLASNRFPVAATTRVELERALASGAITPLRDARPDLPESLVRIVERAMDRDPLRRYPSAGAMERDLLASLGGEGATPGLRDGRPASAGRRRAVAFIASLGAVALALGVWWIVADSPRLDVHADWLRVNGPSEERIRSGAQLAVGDKLVLEIEGSDDIWLYVLNEDAKGEAWILFPLPDLELTNPLSAGTRHVLPGPNLNDGRETSWTVSSVGGEETMVMVASRAPLPELESELAGIARAGSGSSPGLVGRLRGIGGLERRSLDAAPERLSEVLGRLVRKSSPDSEVWVSEVRFATPDPSPR